jgi:lipopolysaccharide export system protein LptC
MNRPITARTDTQTARAYWTMGRSDSERAFRAARRHSRLVRVLRIAVPAAVAVIALVVFLATYFNPLRMLAKLPINVGDVIVSGTKVTMQQPHLAGFTRDGRAYELSAEAAAQDMTKPDLVELHNISAKLQMQDKSKVGMTALTGHYNSKDQMLKLERDINIKSPTYSGHLSEALIDVQKGDVTSDKPVHLNFEQGTLDSNGLKITNSGDVAIFNGGVSMTVKPQQQAAAAPAPAATAGAAPQLKPGAQ